MQQSSEQQKEPEYPKIKCKQHQSNFYEAIILNSESSSMLACIKCIISGGLSGKQLVSLEDVFSSNPNKIMKNWPPLQDQQLQEQINSNDTIQCSKQETVQLINSHFDSLKQNFLQKIEENQQRVLKHIDVLEEKKQNSLEVYNKLSEKDELKNQVINNQNNIEQLEEYLKTTVQKKKSLHQQNEQSLKQYFTDLQIYQQQFSSEYIENVCHQILKKLIEIDFLNPQQFSNKTKEQHGKEDSQVSNKNQQTEKEQQAAHKAEDKTKNPQTKSNYGNQEEVNLLDHINVVESEFGQPQCISYKKMEKNKIEIYRNTHDLNHYGQIIFQEHIIPNYRYQIQVGIKSISFHFLLGLIGKSEVNQKGSASNLTLCSKNPNVGLNKLEKGKKIQELKKIQSMTFQICLNKKIFRCMIVGDNQESTYSLSDWTSVKSDETYYFYAGLSEVNQTLVIKEFKKTNEFKW